MDTKRKRQLTLIITGIVVLTVFCLFVIGKSIYDFVDRINKSENIVEKFNAIYDL